MSCIIKEYKYWGGFRVDTKCDYCSNTFTCKKSSFIKKKRHYCCMEHYALDRRQWDKSLQPTWKGGVHPLKASSEWRKRNREKTRHYKHQYYARKKGANGSHSIDEWECLLAEHDYKCAICKSETILTKDHIRPLSKGGSNFISNIQPLCRSCNSRKNNIYEHPDLLK